MCSCEPSFICAQCAGTPFDPHYFEDDPEPLTEAEFAREIERPVIRWEGWI